MGFYFFFSLFGASTTLGKRFGLLDDKNKERRQIFSLLASPLAKLLEPVAQQEARSQNVLPVVPRVPITLRVVRQVEKKSAAALYFCRPVIQSVYPMW